MPHQSPSSSTKMDVKIIAVGNPGAGKSTLLNSLGGEVLFKSGLNMGNGLTYKLDERINENGHFLDTPGLADEKLRKAAGGAISEGLRMGGQFKVLFFVTEQRGRVVQQDATTMQLVHEAAPEIKSHYGIIVNMVSKGVLKKLNQTEMSFYEFFNAVFAGMADENRCIYSNIFVIGRVDDLEDEEDKVVPPETIIDVNGVTLRNFIDNVVPALTITKENVSEVRIEKFKEMTNKLEKMATEIKLKDERWKEERRRFEQKRIQDAAESKAKLEALEEIQRKNLEETSKERDRLEAKLEAKLKIQEENSRKKIEEMARQMAELKEETGRKPPIKFEAEANMQADYPKENPKKEAEYKANKDTESVTLPKDEIELQPIENEHDCDNENPAMKESVNTKTSIWQRHRCLIISIITVMVISSIAVTLAVVLVPRTPDCNTEGSAGYWAQYNACICKANIVGDNCDKCAAGFSGYPSCKADMKYILVTGLIRNDETAQMEILSEDGTTVICPNAKNKYPDNLSSASGAVTDGTTIVACGGNDVFLLGPVRSCYSYGEDRNWNKLAHMSISRDGSSSVPIPGGIWVTGGYDGNFQFKFEILKSTEMVFLNKTTRLATSLPAARWGHCMVNYGDKIFSTGGEDENRYRTSNVWQFNPANNFAKADGPDMKEKRDDHGCGIVHSIHHGSRPLLVVAGDETSEYWDFTLDGSTWQLCSKDLPIFMWHGPRMTPTADGKGLLMSYEKGVYSFHCTSPNNCYWQQKNYELQISRREHLFLTVPSSLVEDCY